MQDNNSELENTLTSLCKSMLAEINDKYNIELGKQQTLMAEINKKKAELSKLEQDSVMMSKTIAIMTQSGQIARDQAKSHFETIVTNALQYVTQSNDYEFVIQDKGGSKPAYDFFVRSTVDGEKCMQKPEEANGGGFIDIISTTLKYAYLEIFNDPSIKNSTVLLDEPGKMISNDMSIKFAKYIKFLGNNFNRQTIMITHNDNISATADASFVVEKDINGISSVSEEAAMKKDIEESITKLLKESEAVNDNNNEGQ